MNRTERRGGLPDSTNSRAASSIVATPAALSSAPLRIAILARLGVLLDAEMVEMAHQDDIFIRAARVGAGQQADHFRAGKFAPGAGALEADLRLAARSPADAAGARRPRPARERAARGAGEQRRRRSTRSRPWSDAARPPFRCGRRRRPNRSTSVAGREDVAPHRARCGRARRDLDQADRAVSRPRSRPWSTGRAPRLRSASRRASRTERPRSSRGRRGRHNRRS